MDAKAERRKKLQRRNRRQKSLILKAVQMTTLCDAEVIVGIRIRETGRVTTFCSNPEGLWSPAISSLVCS
jgi:SRF-type transcription factor (DNA-binding and dimerisation domain)